MITISRFGVCHVEIEKKIHNYKILDNGDIKKM